MRATKLFLLLAVSLIFLFMNSFSNKKEELTTIIYSFGDSSVPPEYHRSYDITLTRDSVRITVDSYGDILADTTYAIAEGSFDAIAENISRFKIKTCTKKENEGCTGGTSESIKLFEKDICVLSGTVYHCGGDNYGTLCGETKEFGKEIRALIPDFSRLIDR